MMTPWRTAADLSATTSIMGTYVRSVTLTKAPVALDAMVIATQIITARSAITFAPAMSPVVAMGHARKAWDTVSVIVDIGDATVPRNVRNPRMQTYAVVMVFASNAQTTSARVTQAPVTASPHMSAHHVT